MNTYQIWSSRDTIQGPRLAAQVFEFDATSDAIAVKNWRDGRIMSNMDGLTLCRRVNGQVVPVDMDPYRSY